MTSELAKQDVFDHIEMLYNPVRMHSSNDKLSPVMALRGHDPG